MAFNTKNSARATVKGSADWQSRKLDLGNRHRTTLNFGDLVPAFWQHVLPGDKLRLDCNILAKFMPLIAPAFSRMKIKSEWFYVPLRQIAPRTLSMLQDFKPEPSAMSSYFSSILSGKFLYSVDSSDNQQRHEYNGVLSVPAAYISAWLCGDTVTRVLPSNSAAVDASSTDAWQILGSDYSASRWRSEGGCIDSVLNPTNLGQENINSYTSKSRCAKLLSYMGLPSRLTTMKYTSDVLQKNSQMFFNDAEEFNDTFPNIAFDDNNTPWNTTDWNLVSKKYCYLIGGAWNSPSIATSNGWPFFHATDSNPALFPLSHMLSRYGFANAFSRFIESYDSGSSTVTFTDNFTTPVSGSTPDVMPLLPTASDQRISMIPFQSYQKIFNDFYRDEKLQTDEIRYFPDWLVSNDGSRVLDYNTSNFVDFRPFSLFYNTLAIAYNDPYHYGMYQSPTMFFNNLFGLRRRNRSKDVFSSCVTSKVLKGQLTGAVESETVYKAKLQSRLARYFMKKEFTGSTWAEWLSNFFGVNSNDLLNNNVLFLGGRESVVGISENIQNSESSDASAQGNRAGLAGDFHSGSEIYFRVPDFGVVMCIVSVIPDDIDNFNGLQERFLRNSVFEFNLPDFQNVGYSPVFNWRQNIGITSYNATLGWSKAFYGDISKGNSDGVFGYQPFGYAHTYTPNIISGDFQNSLRFWHQSPDLDFDFSRYVPETESYDLKSMIDNQPVLNYNLPSIGLRFLPLGKDLKAQYYNNIFAVTNDESGDHIVADMRFQCDCHRHSAFFTDALDS